MFRQDWTDEKNMEVFGKCSNPRWHGHNYELFVTIKGEISAETGFIMNVGRLKDIIRTRVIDRIDHRNINLEVDFMKGKTATTENLAISIWEELKPFIEKEGAKLHCVRICETENNSIEYYGGKK
jgi:6-pyruvoyltetrahydropterin/6-carboxytetrahydropterin synthase